jgi:putative holliday junction resolvase
MGRILAIDFGLKRTGFAVTDPLKIIATGLSTEPTDNAIGFIKNYLLKESIDKIVIGLPISLKGTDTDATQPVKQFMEKLHLEFPQISVETIDERFTSKIAMQTMISGGMKKKDRRNKENVDRISAVIILQSYLEANSFRL